MKDNCLVVFLKAPEIGEPALVAKYGSEKAQELYIEAAKALYAHLDKIPNAQLACVYTVSPKHRDLRWLDDSDPGFLQFRPEHSEDMAYFNSLHWCFKAGAKRVVHISLTTPQISTESIEKAFTLLHDKQVVLGSDNTKAPYIFGLKEPNCQVLEGYPWKGYPLYEKLFESVRSKRLSYHEMTQLPSIATDEGLDQWRKIQNPQGAQPEEETEDSHEKEHSSRHDNKRAKHH